MGFENFLQSKNDSDENTLQDSNCTSHRLLLTAMDANKASRNSENRKVAEGLPEQDPSTEGKYLLAKVENSKDDILANTTREVQNYLRLENPGGLRSKLIAADFQYTKSRAWVDCISNGWPGKQQLSRSLLIT